MIRRPAALLLAICLAGLAGPRLASAAPPLTQPTVTSADPSPPAAQTPRPVPAPAASTAVSAPVAGRSSATPGAAAVPAAPASLPSAASAVEAPASPAGAVREPPEVPVGADLAVPGAGRGGPDGALRDGPAGLPETTTLMLVALGILAFGCATGLIVLARHAEMTVPDEAAALAAATRRRLQEAPILAWEDPVLARMHLDAHDAGDPAPGASGGPTNGQPPREAGRTRGARRPGSSS